MTATSTAATEQDSERRWREWQARGDRNDRQWAARMRIVLLAAMAVIAITYSIMA